MIATVNGASIAYTDEGHGFPLMFLHGFPFSPDVWSKQVEAFKSQFRVIAPDLRGCYENEAPFGPTCLDHFSNDVHSLMEHLVTGPVVLAGQAMGGLVALAYAHAFPRLVRGLVLVGMKAVWNLPLMGLMSSSVGAEMDGTPPQGWNQAAFSATDADVTAVKKTSVELLLESLRLPTLVIAESDEPSIPGGESLAVNLIPYEGELVALEQADAFNQSMRNWLAWGSRGRQVMHRLPQAV